jgi:tripartite-type tricarboxylate transporter receptor subunit TctC
VIALGNPTHRSRAKRGYAALRQRFANMRVARRAIFASLALGVPALAAYPARPITLVVPYSPGGAADLAARLLVEHVPRLLPQPLSLAIEYRAGASGSVGTLSVARAQPDGLTLLLARTGASAILPATDPRTPYSVEDFTWLGLLDENPFAIAVRADAPWRDLASLLALLRDSPGALTFATAGPATIQDLGVRHMLAEAGLPLDAALALPFRGGGEALAALLGGQAQFIGTNLPDLIAAIRRREVRALVIGAAQRLAVLPDTPTAAEAGLPGLAALSGWNALAGPAGLPGEVVSFWADVLARLAKDPAWLAATRALGSVPRSLDASATRAHVIGEIGLFRDLALRLGLN